MKSFMNRFATNESGATAIEYGLIAALIAVVCIAAFNNVGGGLKEKFNTVASELNKAKSN